LATSCKLAAVGGKPLSIEDLKNDFGIEALFE